MLELRTPSEGTGWSETWTFTGADDRLLRDCLPQLAAFEFKNAYVPEPITPVPLPHAMIGCRQFASSGSG